ncbi:MAG: rhomboid family intramembrane serine protease [Deltaproteobacteria bacterium]|nr:rhomboid family intramembrane serine protease [Deltaproteobacteria bacterium]
MNIETLIALLVGASSVLQIAVVLQRRGWAARGFVALLLVNFLAAAGAALNQGSGVLLFAAVALFCVLVIIPGLLGLLARNAMRRGDFNGAIRLVGFRQHLQPWLGLEREKQLLEGLKLLHEGRGDEAIENARIQLAAGLHGRARQALVERLLTLYVVAQRFDEAHQLFEAEGGLALVSMSPGIAATMVRALGEEGRFEEAARCQGALEKSPGALDPRLAGLVNGARLSFLAHLGCVAALRPLLDEESNVLPGATPARRMLWEGLARQRAGEDDHAQALWREAASQEQDPQAAELARRRLSQVSMLRAPRPLSEETSALVTLVAERAGAYRALPVQRRAFIESAPATALLLVAIVAIHFAATTFSGGTQDPWVLVRLGANFRPVTLVAEPWRLISSMFLHADWLHLGLNAYALYLLGRFAEHLFGTARFWSIYVISGVAGAVTSAALGDGLLSVGASGAIFGLLGAALVGLHALRGQVPDGWRRQLSVNLVVVVALQLAIGFRFEMIDNAAHLGGLAGGLIAALLLGVVQKRAGRFARLRGFFVGALAIMLLASVTLAGAATLASDLDRTLASIPRKTLRRMGLKVPCPVHWFVLDQRGGLSLQDPLLEYQRTLLVLPPQGLTPSAKRMSLLEMAREGDRIMAEKLGQTEGLRKLEHSTVQPERIAADLYRSEVRLLVGENLLYQSHYFKRVGDALLTLGPS